MYNHCVALLKERGVELVDIAECVMYLQKAYIKDITIEKCLVEIDSVLCKREVQNAITTGIYMDKQAEKHLIDDKCLSDLMLNDASLFGIDEVLAYGICNLYGSIALTNYGYIDKVKPLIVGKLNKDHSICNTFLDDIVGAIAASASSKIAHNAVKKNEN